MIRAIVLGAGKGTRLHSEESNLPKVLRKAAGKPIISYVLENISFIPQEETYIVVGYQKDMVIEAVKGNYYFVDQTEQLGTGHAVMMAEEYFSSYEGGVMVLYGDMPLFKRETLEAFAEQHERLKSDCTVMTAISEDIKNYGRIIRDSDCNFADIVEAKDCNSDQFNIKELNVGVYIFNARLLYENLRHLRNDNIQREYYLTDIPRLLMKLGAKVDTYVLDKSDEIYGVNTLQELEFCEKKLNGRI